MKTNSRFVIVMMDEDKLNV